MWQFLQGGLCERCCDLLRDLAERANFEHPFGIDVLLSVCVTLLLMGLLCPIYPCQAAVGVGESYDALDDLFERVTNFLTRFRVYIEKIPQSPTMSNIMAKIMVEVLNVLALTTKHINQGRFSKWPIMCRSSLANLV